MITMLGTRRRACRGPSRRETLKVGALSLLGGYLHSTALQAIGTHRSSHAPPARAKRVILLYLQGGAPTQDMYDLKPEASSDVRCEFAPVSSSAPGIDVCELLPLTARVMDKTCVVRSVYHNGPCHNNQPMYTGRDDNLRDEDARSSDPPSMGSVIAKFDESQRRRSPVPPYVFVPCPLGWGERRVKGGPHGGFLGHRYDPFSTTCKAHVANPPDENWNPQMVLGEPLLNELQLSDGITLDRLSRRRDLLEQFDDQLRHQERTQSVNQFNQRQNVAFDLLTSKAIRAAFDFHQEPAERRQRYGRTLFGTSTLLARRLAEAGSRFINVSYDNMGKRFGVAQSAWDTHGRNFNMLKRSLLPDFDRAYSALIEDLDRSGMLDETLVVVMGEMGRTPKINKDAGRDHWTHCYSVLLAGGGIRGGVAYGASDGDAAWIKERPVHISDICATIYYSLGIEPDMSIYDRTSRPLPVARGGSALTELF